MSTAAEFDFTQLYCWTTISGHKHLMVRPGVFLLLYLDAPLPEIAVHAADAIELYTATIPKGVLRSYLARNGQYRELTDRQVAKDLKTLRALPADYEGFTLDYSEGTLGQVGTHAVSFLGAMPNPANERRSNLLRFEFPEDVVDKQGDEAFLRFVEKASATVPFSSGHAGFAFKRAMTLESKSMTAIVPLLTRFLGFDPSDYWVRRKMKDRSPGAHWINLLGGALSKRAGESTAIRTALKSVDVRDLPNGVLIRGARLPPIGDVNRKATDVGCVPEVARLLKPFRCEDLKFAHTDFDAVKWLARFDDMPSRPWDNS